MGLPAGLGFRTKGQLAIDICADAYADGLRFDVVCGDEVYGNCTPLREFFEQQGQAYVLRVASTFMIELPSGDRMTCAKAVTAAGRDTRRWEVRSAGTGIEGTTLVHVGVDRHRLAAASPAGPPSPTYR